MINFTWINLKYFDLTFTYKKQSVFVKQNAPDNGQFHNHKIQDHKDKYFDTSRKNLSQEMTICNMEALISYPTEVMTNVNIF